MALVIAATVFSWAVTTKHALDRGIFNFDSLWYHLPFAVDMVQTHSVVGMHHVETVFANWFYPQNSELLHAVGILQTGRDTLSLFLNFGWLAMAFLAAYCVGRPYGRGALTTVAAAILLACHTLVVRDPGAAKNDLAAAALLLASIAVLVEGWAKGENAVVSAMREERRSHGGMERWAVAAAGLAAGLAAGTRVTGLAMAAALTLAVVVLTARGRRWASFGWWFLPALAGGGFWYLRNLVVAGNPIPEVKSLGPISLPHPERLQLGRPEFDIAHYATDTGVWRHYFAPALHEAFGVLWPLVVLGAAAAALLALLHGRNRVVRWMGAVALFGLVAYLFTPLSAADRLPAAAPLPRGPLREHRLNGGADPRHGPEQGLPLGSRRRGRPHRPRRHHRRLRRLRLLRRRPHQPRHLPRRRGPARRLQRDPRLRRLPRRRQRRRPRLPSHRSFPQLPPPRRPDPFARGALAAPGAGGPPAPPGSPGRRRED